VFHDTVAGVIPDVYTEGEVRFGFHGQARFDSPWPTLFIRLLLRLAYLSQKLDQPLPTKDGGTLRTVADARAYMLGLSKQRELQTRWQRVAELILEADIGAVSRQLELALFMDANLDVAKMPA
jgi:hypothetical protein